MPCSIRGWGQKGGGIHGGGRGNTLRRRGAVGGGRDARRGAAGYVATGVEEKEEVEERDRRFERSSCAAFKSHFNAASTRHITSSPNSRMPVGFMEWMRGC